MHPDRGSIELAMAKGVGRRQAGARYGVSPDAVQRHLRHHVSDEQKRLRKLDALKPGANLKALVDEEDHGLLDNLRIVRAGLLHRYDSAVQIGSDASVAQLSSQLHRNLDLAGRAVGDIRTHSTSEVVHLHLTPDFLRLRTMLIKALRPFPEPLAAVVAILQSMDPPPALGPPAAIEGRVTEASHG
jgi:hypothetical protein